MRFIFRDANEFKQWIESHIEKGRYDAYITNDLEIILVPLISTRPIKFAYGKFESKIVEELKALLSSKGINIYYVYSIEWDETKAVGVRIPIGEE